MTEFHVSKQNHGKKEGRCSLKTLKKKISGRITYSYKQIYNIGNLIFGNISLFLISLNLNNF